MLSVPSSSNCIPNNSGQVPNNSGQVPNNSGQVPNVPRQAVKFSHIRLTDRVSLILFKNGLLNEEFSMSSAAKGKALPA